jgi:hypothetical protein
LPRPARLVTLRVTLRLLYRCHPRAFVTSSIASLFEPLFFPALLLLLHQLLQEVIGSGGTVHFTRAVAFIGLGLVILVLAQGLGIILRDSSSTILRQEARVVISKRIMRKLPDVPYSLFENNAFRARYAHMAAGPCGTPTALFSRIKWPIGVILTKRSVIPFSSYIGVYIAVLF